MDHDHEDQSERIHEYVSLDPVDFFPASYPRVPLVRVALTVWLSKIPALGSGSFPAASRT
jgi:hypothetical protein